MITAVSQNKFHTPQQQTFGSIIGPEYQSSFKEEDIKKLASREKPTPFFNTNNLDLKIMAAIMPVTMLATGAAMLISISRVGDDKLQARLEAEAYKKPAITDTLKLSKKVLDTAKQLKK